MSAGRVRSRRNRSTTFSFIKTSMLGPLGTSCRCAKPCASKMRKQPSRYLLNFHILSSSRSGFGSCCIRCSFICQTAPRGSISTCPIRWKSFLAVINFFVACSFRTWCRTRMMPRAFSLKPSCCTCCSSETKKWAKASQCCGKSKRQILRKTMASSTRCGMDPATATLMSFRMQSLTSRFSSGSMVFTCLCCQCRSTTFLHIKMAKYLPCGSAEPSA
mmetsp:Transcript_149557/g.272322  ORF Transcript_149557/g.272322 Transcript_149557/m.272322 type:complete len:217 (-) Transcript_149557:343-993(-)